MSITAWIAVLVIIATIYCLIKRYETRLVLFTAGLFLCCISMKPMAALDQFAKSMTNANLIMAICGAMGFAYVVPKLPRNSSVLTFSPSSFAGICC